MAVERRGRPRQRPLHRGLERRRHHRPGRRLHRSRRRPGPRRGGPIPLARRPPFQGRYLGGPPVQWPGVLGLLVEGYQRRQPPGVRARLRVLPARDPMEERFQRQRDRRLFVSLRFPGQLLRPGLGKPVLLLRQRRRQPLRRGGAADREQEHLPEPALQHGPRQRRPGKPAARLRYVHHRARADPVRRAGLRTPFPARHPDGAGHRLGEGPGAGQVGQLVEGPPELQREPQQHRRRGRGTTTASAGKAC